MSGTATRLVVLVPVVAALLGLLVARRADVRAARLLAVGAAVLGVLFALAEVVGVHGSSGARTVSSIPALAAGELRIPLQLQATTATATIALVVAVVGWAVQVFAGWYLKDDDRYGIFAATVSLFTGAMLLVVQSADLVLTLVGWEVMGWCSYLLIGHWSRKETARRAALKAFLVTRLADVGFVLGVVILAAGAGSTAYRRVVQSWAGTGCNDAGACTGPSTTLLNAAMVLLVIGILGKSGMVPFHDWLPDAMEGPTPASALIHAATMVAAGTFVLAQLFDVLAAADGARWLLALSTAVTMVYAAVLAFGQSDLKRLLAYSTLSQVALMLSALAVAPADDGPGAGVLHLYSHAFFKALLFLAIGWLSVTVGGTAAATMRGGVRGHLFIRPAMFVGLLSLAGVPPLVGFVSKEHVLDAAEAGIGAGEARAWLVLLAGLLTVALTAAYCMRAWIVLDDLGSADIERHDADTATVGVRTAVTVLTVLTVVGGLVVVTPLLDLGGHIGWLVALLSILLIVGAGLAVRSVAAGKDPAVRVVGARMPSFDAGLGVDRLYVALVARPVLALAHLVVFLDREVVDAYVRGAAAATRFGGTGGQRAHRGEVAASGLAWVVAGVVAVALAGVALW
ncbi:NADH-quinone oxidoreductase subunit L [Phycicoccus sp. Soil803]|uniref:NADH-quinone oxidoreductase subunit 5 family protein n=1 Tax=Phycicoccus sp. Soil803 TaxID=1736415 RepID=UPI00070DE199|nr:NADH-quinone oxidoreductase subunit L [Phycicoccus sp. Soil803]KRF26109.1 hypothetical protein ASG95_17790 [Phycicoccus sp. Soil803]